MPLAPINVVTQAITRSNTALSITVPNVLAGDLLIFKGAKEGAQSALGSPTTTGETWVKPTNGSAGTSSADAYASIFVMVAATDGTKVVGVTSSNNQSHSGVVEHYRDAQVTTAAVSTNDGGSAPSLSITTQVDGSVVTWVSSDWNAVAHGSITYRSGATQELVAGTAGSDYFAAFARQDAPTAGAQTVGMTQPTGQKPSMVALEIQPVATTPPNQGGISGSVSWVGSVAGETTKAGSVSGQVAWVGQAHGQVVHQGALAGSLSWVGQVHGARASEGSLAGSLKWVGQVHGQAPSVGASAGGIAGSVSWVGAVHGETSKSGGASGSVSWVGQVHGRSPAVGENNGGIAGSISWVGQVTGQTNRSGHIAGQVSWADQVTGQTKKSGAVSGSIAWVGQVHGRTVEIGDGTPVENAPLVLDFIVHALVVDMVGALDLDIFDSRLEFDVTPTLFVNDTAPALSGRVAANLTGATLELRIRWADGTTFTKAAEVINGVDGTWKTADWQAGEISVPGPAEVWLHVTYSTEQGQTFGPALVEVEESA